MSGMSAHRMASRPDTQSTADRLAAIGQALSDPLRVDILARMARQDELACTSLEATLPVTKSTISYHMKVLYRAGLVDIRKAGRYYFYRSRRDVTDTCLPGVWESLAALPVEPEPEPGQDGP
jgi:DNA-binding transcriptional ArsR family regulator